MSSPVTLGRAYRLLDTLQRAVDLRDPRAFRIEPVGGLRRFEDTFPLQLLVTTSSSRRAAEWLTSLARGPELRILERRGRAAMLLLDGERIRLHFVPERERGIGLLYHTGSRPHLAALKRHGADRARHLTATGIVDLRDGSVRTTESEEEAYDLLGLPFIPPELRQGAGELEAAREGRLPRLVRVDDIRGDLHVHTHWSDGRDSIESMVQAARGAGYEYVAITDHSPSAAASRVLTLEHVADQANEIAGLRLRYPEIGILHGVEVDILPDGRLDLPDETLARLDLVLASLHDAAGQSGAQLTERYLAAIHHPLVNVITHPGNRIVGGRPGYDLDWDRIFRAAAETGTALEIDGAPSHLDLDGSGARRAAAAGVTLTIDSDCHRAASLGRQMAFGVGTARRGWIEPRHVLNTRPLERIRAFVASKRRQAGR